MRAREELVTESFYAWEVRGRGWTEASYPVDLEPPYRPFFILQHGEAGSFDDGRRPTILGRAFRWIWSWLRPPPPSAELPSFEEQEPFPQGEPPSLATLRLEVPSDLALEHGVLEALIRALTSLLYPVSYEVVACAHSITIQLACAANEAHRVTTHLRSILPAVSVYGAPDALQGEWSEGRSHALLQLALRDEFFLPIRHGHELTVHPLAALVPALTGLRSGEFVALQVLFAGTRNPWPGAIRSAVSDGDGGCLFADAPHFTKAVVEKTGSPLVAASLRIVAQAERPELARALLVPTAAYCAQFDSAEGNGLAPLHVRTASSDEVLGRVTTTTGMLLSTDELASIVALPDRTLAHIGFLARTLPNVPLPEAARGHALVLGIHHHEGTQTAATVDGESRFAHTWVIGGSGTGKSTLLANLILADMDAGHGVLVLDPHGDLVDDLLGRVPERRRDDVILFDPADTERPIGLPVLSAADPREEIVLASDLVAIMKRLATSWGDSMSTVLGEAVVALLRKPGGASLLDMKRFLVDDSWRSEVLASISDPQVRQFWTKEYPLIGARSIGPLLSRLDAFVRMPLMRNILGQRSGGIPFGEALGQGRILLARLSKGEIGEENTALLGSLLLTRVNQHVLLRQSVARDERRPFFVYADEAHHFLTPSTESLITEGRKYRVGLTLAHQTLGQLAEVRRIESALLANCHTRIVFRVGDEDAGALARGFEHFDAALLRSLPRGNAVVRLGGARDDFRVEAHQISVVDDHVAQEVRDVLRRRSRECYGTTPMRDVEAASTIAPPPTETAPQPGQRISTPAISTAREAPPSPGRGGQMHKYLQHLTKRLAEERGFRAVIEGRAGPGQADVALEREGKRVAVEISVTTDPEHEIENLKKCLAAGFASVIFVSPERKTRESVSRAADTMGLAVTVLGPESVVEALDGLGPPAPIESLVRGYTVKVTRQMQTPEQVTARRGAIAGVIARSLRG